jgi:PadR family transcriptional regulator, regulatory protein PadR
MAARKTLQRALLLRAMLEAPLAEWYGLELSKAAGLQSGTVYPALAALERAGLLASHWEDVDPAAEKRPRRRLYRLVPHRVIEAREYVSRFDIALGQSKARIPARSVLRPKGGFA